MSASEETHGPRAHDPPETVLGSKADSQELHDLAEKAVELQASERPDSGGVASYREFAAALIEIGLIDAAELERFAVDSAEGVLGLSRALVKAGKLTPYQAAAVYQKKSRGLLIGNYLILDKVGQGGMGMVFKARHRKLGRLGALKILPPSFARDRDAVMRFRREFEAAGRLKHLNLVAAFEADEDRGVHFLVMDYVEGTSFRRPCRANISRPKTESRPWMRRRFDTRSSCERIGRQVQVHQQQPEVGPAAERVEGGLVAVGGGVAEADRRCKPEQCQRLDGLGVGLVRRHTRA